MSVVVDASVALKWVLIEEDRDLALALLGGGGLIAPDLIHIECANALTTRVRRGLIGAAEAAEALDAIVAAPIVIRPSANLVAKAHTLSGDLQKSAYDCLYLALAMSEEAVVVTADRRFADAVTPRVEYARYIRTLGAPPT